MIPGSTNDSGSSEFCQEQSAHCAGTARDAFGHSCSFGHGQLLLLKKKKSLLVLLLCHVALHYHPKGTNRNLKNIILMNNRIAPHWSLPPEGFIDQINCYHHTKC